MPGWLSKSPVSVGRRSPSDPEPYEIECGCGYTMRGMRQEHAQRILCDQCREPLFVLPLDVYPDPAPPASRKKKKKKKKRGSSQASSGESPATAVKNAAALFSDRLKDGARVAGTKVSDAGRGMAASASEIARNQRRKFTPVRLVVLCIVAIATLTIYWVWQAKLLEQARLDLRTASENGYAALQEGNFPVAAQEFQKAVHALEVLEQHDLRAREIHQMKRESVAASELLPISLFELIQEAQEARDAGALEEWQSRLEYVYRGMWIVLDAPVYASAKDQEKTHFVVDIPLMVRDTPVLLEADLPVFESLSYTDGRGRAIFAAQLEDCRFRDSEPQRWVIRLRRQSAFLWSNLDNFENLGFTPDANIQQLLDEQAHEIGIVE